MLLVLMQGIRKPLHCFHGTNLVGITLAPLQEVRGGPAPDR